MAQPRQLDAGGYFKKLDNGQTAWVPYNPAVGNQIARQQHGEVMGTLAAPMIPFATPALGSLGNLIGHGAAGVANSGPSLQSWMFGAVPDAPPPAAAQPGGLVYTLNASGAPATAGPKPAARPLTPTSATDLEVAANNATRPRIVDTRSALSQMFPNARITGGDRTSERNAQVGGSRNSWHLQPGVAIDMAPIQGESVESVKRRLESLGFEVMEAIDETKKTKGTGPHWHFAARPKQGGTSSASAGSGATSTYSVNDIASAFAGGPVRQRQNFQLPNAPTEAMPLDMPQLQELDKNILLAELRAASQVDRRDRSFDGTDRFAAMLGAMAANMKGEQDTVDMILGMGAGAHAGLKGERENQEAKNLAEAALIRELNINLANAGINVDTANHTTRNSNLDRTWQSGENRRSVGFNNLNRAYERDVAQTQMDAGVDSANVSEANNWAQAKASITAQAMSQVNSQNFQREENQTNRQFQLGITALKQDGSSGPGVNQLLASQGITAERLQGEPQTHTNARVAAPMFAAGNTEGAILALARESILNGTYREFVPEEVVKSLDEAIAAENVEGAAYTLNQLFNQALRDPTHAAQMMEFIEENAGTGNPVARMWLGQAKAITPAQ